MTAPAATSISRFDIAPMSAVITALSKFAARTPDAVALEGDTVCLSYATLLVEVECFSKRLQQLKHRTIGLLADNSPAWVITDLAAQKAGVTLIPIPGFFSPDQIRHALHDSGVELLLTDQPSLISQWLPEMKQRPLAKIGGQNLWGIQVTGSKPIRTLNNIAKITYTSGTTGTPKGVCLSQAVMDRVACSLAGAIGITAKDHHLCLLPLAVLLENIGGIYVPLLSGARCILPGLSHVGAVGAARLDPERMLKAIADSQATSVIMLPQMLQTLVSLLESSNAEPPKKLRFIAVGGAPVSPLILERANSLGLPVYEGYGLSECGSVVALNTPVHHRPGSVGKILPHVQVKFSSDDEIMLSGNLFSGYLHHEVPGEKWYASGDIGHLDADGYLYITGRKKNIFITSFGRNVAPEWVEKELTVSPYIAQAAVFGEARPFNVAVIVFRQGGPADAASHIADAIEQANKILPDYARVSAWISADEPFSISNHQFTATGRPRRDAIWATYGERINHLYPHGKEQIQRRQI